MNIKAPIAAIIVAMCMAACTGFGNAPYQKCEGSVWATTYHITYRSHKPLHDSIIHVMKQVEMSLSPFADSSTVSLINSGLSVSTDTLFRRIFNASKKVNTLSHGAFDPTVAPLVNLWGFGYRNAPTPPTEAMIDSALRLVGIAKCRIVADTIVRPDKRMEFNFSAITKGYGCDLVGEMLRRNGCRDYMVEIGGEIAVSGTNPRGEKWHIMVDAPEENDTAVVHSRMAVIAITEAGVATSGNYRNYRKSSQGKVWHTIDPVTGHPARQHILSATVIAPSAMLADALATACMAMPIADAVTMIEAIPGTSALFVQPADSSYSIIRTSHFPPPLNF